MPAMPAFENEDSFKFPKPSGSGDLKSAIKPSRSFSKSASPPPVGPNNTQHPALTPRWRTGQVKSTFTELSESDHFFKVIEDDEEKEITLEDKKPVSGPVLKSKSAHLYVP